MNSISINLFNKDLKILTVTLKSASKKFISTSSLNQNQKKKNVKEFPYPNLIIYIWLNPNPITLERLKRFLSNNNLYIHLKKWRKKKKRDRSTANKKITYIPLKIKNEKIRRKLWEVSYRRHEREFMGASTFRDRTNLACARERMRKVSVDSRN